MPVYYLISNDRNYNIKYIFVSCDVIYLPKY